MVKKVLVVFALMPMMALATMWYVNGASGSDSNSGTSTSVPKATIQAAIDASSAGDTILVAPGTYASITTENKAIIIRSQSGAATTIIDGGNSDRCAYLGEGEDDISTVLDGFTLVNGHLYISWTGAGGAGVRCGTVKNCIIQDCSIDGSWSGYGGEGGGAWGSRLENCEISNCSALAGGGMRLGSAKNCIFSGNYARDDGGATHGSMSMNCLFTDNMAYNTGGGGAGAAGTDATNYNCTVVNNHANSGGIFSGQTVLVNCIVYDNTWDSGSLTYEDSEQHTSMVNCYTDSPSFVDAANGDYRLAAGSPCIDAGDNSYVTTTTDLAGNARIVNGKVDIGCYEYGSSTVGGATWYVNGSTGSDSNSGMSESAPKATIQAAIDVSAAGDTILVAAGAYGLFASNNKRIIVKSVGGAQETIIDGLGVYNSESTILWLSEDFDSDARPAITNTVLEGFTVKGLSNVHGGTLKSCVIRDNDTWSLGGAALYYGIAENCLFLNNRGMNGAAADGCILRNCTLVGNSARDINGVCMNSILENCIVYGNANDERSTWQYWFDRNPLVTSSDHREENVYVGNPGFVDAANGDYRLAAGSPCIDAGDNSYVTTTTDLAGNARIANSTVDIGCYEYGASAAVDGLYMVIDISGGASAESYPVTYLDAVPSGGWTDEYKTTKIVLRRIAPGTFTMGNQAHPDYTLSTGYMVYSNVTLTAAYYIGVFEMTQNQYELIMGQNPSVYLGTERPVDSVTYDMIRGAVEGAKWPQSANVDADSFMGRLRAKTGLQFDLPTEAQWEYACRAGTTTDYNNGKNFSSWYTDPSTDEVARYLNTQSDGKGGYNEHTTVGSYFVNDWGLYDMHGNVVEWCLDWFSYDLAADVCDPVGPVAGEQRSQRGGSWDSHGHHTASFVRHHREPDWAELAVAGFRIAMTSGNTIQPPTHEPRTWYVNGLTGSDSNSGTSASAPKATIQAAIDASAAGDTILVFAGTYSERLEISSGITVKSMSGPRDTTIFGQTGYSVVRILEGASGTVIEGFEITGGTGEPNPSSYGYDYYGGGVRCRASATIRNCIIHGNGHGTPRTNSGTFGGGISSGSGSVLVENCLFYDNFAWACGGATFVESDDGEMTLLNCTIYGNDSTDFFGYQGGVGLANGATVKVENCIVWGNGGSQIDAYSWPYNSDTTAKVSYSCVQGGVVKENVATLNSGAGNVSATPNFVDAANGDYRLAAGSPCIDAGDNSYVTTTTDLAGNARIANGTVDIGCYEYGATTEPMGNNGLSISYYDAGNLATLRSFNMESATYEDAINFFAKRTPSLVTNTSDIGTSLDFGGTLTTCRFHGKYIDSATEYFWAFMKGSIALLESGLYEFGFDCDDSCVIYIDGQKVVGSSNNYDSYWFCQEYASIWLTAGNHEMVIVYGENITDQGLTVYMKRPSESSASPLPQSILYDGTPVTPTTTCTVTFDLNGADGVAPAERQVAERAAIGDLPTVSRTGYTCLGWFTAASGGTQVSASTTVTGNVTYYAQWRINSYTATFDANGGTGGGTVARNHGAALGELPVPTRDGFSFDGWFTAASGGAEVSYATVITGAVTFYAHWTEVALYPTPVWYDEDGEEIDWTRYYDGDEEPFAAESAATFDGYVLDGEEVCGIVQVKVGKANKRTATSKVTASLTLLGETKKRSYKGTMSKRGIAELTCSGKGNLSLCLGTNAMWGEVNGLSISGARNVFAKAGDPKAAALSKWQGSYALVLETVDAEGSGSAFAWGYSGLTVTVGAKGKVKVQGTMVDGAKVNVSSQLLVGERRCCIPVVVPLYSKKGGFALNLWLQEDGAIEVGEISCWDATPSKTPFKAWFGENVPAARAGAALPETLSFLFFGEPEADGMEFLYDYLPWEVVFKAGAKWTLPAAGNIKYDREAEEWYDAKESENPAGLKLTYVSKTGAFKGTVKLYAVDDAGRLKKLTANVSGVMVGRRGYGTATVKGVGSWPVGIE